MMKKIVFLLPFLLFSYACVDDEDCCDYPEDVYSKSYVTYYTSVDSLCLFPFKGEEGKMWYEYVDTAIHFKIKGEGYCGYMSADVSKWPVFDSLAAKYGDTTYCDYLEVRYSAICSAVEEVLVVSDADFDPLHPAGTPLNDVANLCFSSFAPFVRNGYVEEGIDNYSGRGITDVYMPLSEFTKEQGVLWAMVGAIYFPTPPTLSKRHHFTVTFRFDNGTTLSKGVEMEFE